jgi:two-component system, LytTR family, sensor kinase
MNRQQLTQHLSNSPDRSLRRIRLKGVNLSNLDFSGFDLTDADLSFSNIRRSNFNGANLHGANLSFANLGGSSFINTDLRGANLSFSGMAGVDLSRANIEGASFSFSGISRSVLQPGKRPPESLTLTTLLQQKTWWSMVIIALLGALIMYGVSAIVYFTNQIANANDPQVAQLNQFIIWQNVNSGILSALITSLLAGPSDTMRLPTWARHLLLSGAVVGVWMSVQIIRFILVGPFTVNTELSRNHSEYASPDAPWYLYALGPLLICNLFYYLQRQGRQLGRKLSEQEYQLLNMEKLKTRAQLDALQAKINPHFLYNALNSIASLVHEDPNKAEEMTMLLSKLFRYTTGRDGSYFCTLADELEMVSTYLRVEQVRFGNRLHFTVNVADVSLNNLQLPQFLLQPIVENAVKHGISKRADGGTIAVAIFERDGWLHLTVSDNGPAFPETMGGGYGLRSIQEKLTLLYGDDARVEFQNEPTKQVAILVKKGNL